MQNMIPARRQAGFTLIELVMVIVILGILSAFALPRFADLSGDAEESAVKGARGSVKSTIGIVRAAALAEGKGDISTPGTNATADDRVSLEGTPVDLTEGHLAAASLSDAAQLDDFAVVTGTANGIDRVVTVDPAESGQPCFNFREATSSRSSEASGMGSMSSATECDGTF